MPVAKIVILNWNGAEHLRRFLPSVVAAAPAGVEVVVADNGSTDDSLRVLATEFPSVGVLRLDANYGFAGGYNRALKQVEADYYLLLNSDIETPEGWLAPILDVLEREPDVAVVSPNLMDRPHGIRICRRFGRIYRLSRLSVLPGPHPQTGRGRRGPVRRRPRRFLGQRRRILLPGRCFPCAGRL